MHRVRNWQEKTNKNSVRTCWRLSPAKSPLLFRFLNGAVDTGRRGTMRTLDAVHGSILTSDGPKSIAQFDWESVSHNADGESIDEDTVTFSDMSAAFSLLLSWMCGRSDQNRQAPSIEMAGWRAHALLYLLDPTNAPLQFVRGDRNSRRSDQGGCKQVSNGPASRVGWNIADEIIRLVGQLPESTELRGRRARAQLVFAEG
jgi:hypothetical protein